MHSSLIVARINPGSEADVARLFSDFDSTDMPALMGTRRRQLFEFHGLYFHLQDFDDDGGADHIEAAREQERFVRISADLKPHIEAYDPRTWRSPADALAHRFYAWEDGR